MMMNADHLYHAGLRYVVAIHEHINAAFMQEQTAKEYYETCAHNARDLSNAHVKLYRLNADGTAKPLLSFIGPSNIYRGFAY